MSATDQQGVTLGVPGGAKTIHDTSEQGRWHLPLSVSSQVKDVLEKLALRYELYFPGVH